MTASAPPPAPVTSRWSAGCGIGCGLLVLAAVAGLVWAGISFARWTPPPEYDEATTQDAVAAHPSCEEIRTAHMDDDVPEEQRYDVRAQMELEARRHAIGMLCDQNVQVACDPRSACQIWYADESATLRVIHGTCYTLVDRLCHYRLEPQDHLLSQRRLNDRFAGFAQEQREDGSILRCDTIPGGADQLPPIQDDLEASPVRTNYRCYTREPGHITYTYEVLVHRSGYIEFGELDD